jgi:HK97 family phage portal protein
LHLRWLHPGGCVAGQLAALDGAGEHEREHLECLPGPLGAEPGVDQAGDPLAYGEGVDAGERPVPESWEDVAVLETTQANVRTICRYFGVNPELVGADSGNSLTYANVEQRALDFLTFGLRPWLVRLEVALSALLSSTTTVKFNAAALVRTDLLTRYQAHESAIRAGWKLRSEVRELEDLAPIAGIDDQPGGAVA